MQLPFYEKPLYPRFPLAPGHMVHMLDIVDFLKWVVERDQLEITNFLERMKQDPFLLVAATGLGKTVGVPLHVLIRQAQRAGQSPRPTPIIWVVEPTVPIATDQAFFMNNLWEEYQVSRGRHDVPPLFGCISKPSGNINPDAPIRFVTTGIFEKLTQDNELRPERDRVIIDETHVTVERSWGMEFGIGLARNAGVTVDYMSATVDTTGLAELLGVDVIRADQQRYSVWKCNLLGSMGEKIVELIEETLIHPNPSVRFYPKADYPNAEEVITAVMEPGRSHGMLVIVNSFAGTYSDVRLLSGIVRKAFPKLHILHLASEIIRNSRRLKAFQQELASIEAAKENYLIFATSVVEMGVTFATLDYVATMDAAYEQETIGNVTFPVEAALSVNSFFQRIGRVGRRRAGIAYISLDVGASYAQLDNEELNRPVALANEPIRFPLLSSPLMPLAYYICKQGWENVEAEIAALNLPSKLHQNPDRMEYLREQVAMLQSLGLAEGNHLTPLGISVAEWIGRYDLAYATQLQRRLDEGASATEIIFWVVATALSSKPIVTLRNAYDYFVDYEKQHATVPHTTEVWHETTHEDIAAFNAVAQVMSLFPSACTAEADDWNRLELDRYLNVAGLDARKLRKALEAIDDTLRLFIKGVGNLEKFQAAFGPRADTLSVAIIPWPVLRSQLPTEELREQLEDLPGTTLVKLTANPALGGFGWLDTRHGHAGILVQDDTPVLLENDKLYVARSVPSRRSKEAEVTWRLAHLGQSLPKPPPTEILPVVVPVEPPPKKPSVLEWIHRFDEWTPRWLRRRKDRE